MKPGIAYLITLLGFGLIGFINAFPPLAYLGFIVLGVGVTLGLSST